MKRPAQQEEALGQVRKSLLLKLGPVDRSMRIGWELGEDAETWAPPNVPIKLRI